MPPPRPLSNPIVAVGLLTQRDVDMLGAGFRRIFPLDNAGAFDDLLKELDALERDEVPER